MAAINDRVRDRNWSRAWISVRGTGIKFRHRAWVCRSADTGGPCLAAMTGWRKENRQTSCRLGRRRLATIDATANSAQCRTTAGDAGVGRPWCRRCIEFYVHQRARLCLWFRQRHVGQQLHQASHRSVHHVSPRLPLPSFASQTPRPVLCQSGIQGPRWQCKTMHKLLLYIVVCELLVSSFC